MEQGVLSFSSDLAADLRLGEGRAHRVDGVTGGFFTTWHSGQQLDEVVCGVVVRRTCCPEPCVNNMRNKIKEKIGEIKENISNRSGNIF